ncbi:MAG: hypothetical protein II200_02960, partial [Bacteroidaceae bacterium]|nr:hypothetical protein [Bacteroidaceae bacterium]
TAVAKELFFSKKVLLKLSSTLKLRNFDYGMKMVAVAPHHWFVQSFLATCITFGVGAIALSIPEAMRRPECGIKQI